MRPKFERQTQSKIECIFTTNKEREVKIEKGAEREEALRARRAGRLRVQCSGCQWSCMIIPLFAYVSDVHGLFWETWRLGVGHGDYQRGTYGGREASLKSSFRLGERADGSRYKEMQKKADPCPARAKRRACLSACASAIKGVEAYFPMSSNKVSGV